MKMKNDLFGQYLSPAEHKHLSRVSKYKPHESELNMTDIDDPVKIWTNTYKKFERPNEKIILIVFDCDNKKIFPLYISKKSKTIETTEVDLLIIHDKEKHHFSRLMSSLSKHDDKKYCCMITQIFTKVTSFKS